MLERPNEDDYAVAFTQDEVASGVYGNSLSNVWPMAQERFVAEPHELPATDEAFRTGVTVAALHAAVGTDVVADIGGNRGGHGRPGDHRRRRGAQSTPEPRRTREQRLPNRELAGSRNRRRPRQRRRRDRGLGPYYEEYSTGSVTLRHA